MSGTQCFRCGGPITAGQTFLNASGHTWHDRCFTCKKCNKQLGTGDFYNLNGETYCPDCHETHDVPICNECQQPLRRGSDYLKFEGVPFHVRCFTCQNCSRELNTNDFFRHNGKRYCGSCSDRMTGSGSSSGSGSLPYSNNYSAPPPKSTPSYSNNTSSNNYSYNQPASTSSFTPQSNYSSSISAKPVEPSYLADTSYNPPQDNNDFSAEITIGVTTPSSANTYHDTSGGGGGSFNYEDNDLNALVNELEKSGSEFNAKYGSTYQPAGHGHGHSHATKSNDDELSAALASLQEFDS